MGSDYWNASTTNNAEFGTPGSAARQCGQNGALAQVPPPQTCGRDARVPRDGPWPAPGAKHTSPGRSGAEPRSAAPANMRAGRPRSQGRATRAWINPSLRTSTGGIWPSENGGRPGREGQKDLSPGGNWGRIVSDGQPARNHRGAQWGPYKKKEGYNDVTRCYRRYPCTL